MMDALFDAPCGRASIPERGQDASLVDNNATVARILMQPQDPFRRDDGLQ